ncbi:Bub2 protein [Mycena indigotica]|uniref:Bub2 protein n=1 Tax=Mycena indigotica TaxID=2126181 RepID=A0A8H6TCN7_9AGAR|nr:Bub2 protein [Mycena indigotica]KAF7315263.1 Bub2 protein [Mycena indigotica]
MSSSSSTAHSFNKILNQPRNASKSRSGDIDDYTKKLRRMILVEGIPSTVDPTLRPRIWKILLRVNNLSAESFLRYVARGPCEVREKIRNDTFRTLATDRGFKERVREDMLIRLLDAFVWRNHDRQESHQLGFTYVQGMNVLAAPFLYTMPSEVEAFYCFSKFIEESCPLYVQPTLEGVHRGLKLLDRCLKIVDPELYSYLRSKNLSAEIYAFPCALFCVQAVAFLTTLSCINTLCMYPTIGPSSPTLGLPSGFWSPPQRSLCHCSIIINSRRCNGVFKARSLSIYSDACYSLSLSSPMRLLRTFPPLEALPVIGIAVTLVRDLPGPLYDELVKHPYEIQTPR